MNRLFTFLIATLCCIGIASAQVDANTTRVVGGDLSLVPAYENAGDQWLDANGNVISDLITYSRDICGWNAVRVRLFVEPDRDESPATCQDLEYVKALGKRIKDAGMFFLLDIHYSDTWADVAVQAIPRSWNMSRSTATEDIAAKVYSYTKESLQALIDAGATPDYVQVGNEVSYGMLWDICSFSSSGNTMNSKALACYPAQDYSKYASQWSRFATLLSNGAKAVRELCPDAKVVLHTERAANATATVNFYKFIEQAGFADYDIIGLSYYPFWHSDLATLKGTLSSLVSNFPNKEIQIVEAGYYNNSNIGSNTYNTSSTWAYSPEGQAAFLKDLITALKSYNTITGLYYWQPEECGNGADENGVSQVMGTWDNRGFWQLTWKSGQHALISEDALMSLKDFPHTEIGGNSGSDINTPQDASEYFTNLNFEQCTDADGIVGWTVNYDLGFSDGPWFKACDEWGSALTDGLRLQAWNEANNALAAGNIISQSATVPNGEYTVSVAVHASQGCINLFANDATTEVTPASAWGTANNISTTVTVTDGNLNIGLYCAGLNSSSELNLYVDNFKVSYIPASGINEVVAEATTPETLVCVHDITGRLIRSNVPFKHSLNGLNKGIYIIAGKKYIVK